MLYLWYLYCANNLFVHSFVKDLEDVLLSIMMYDLGQQKPQIYKHFPI